MKHQNNEINLMGSWAHRGFIFLMPLKPLIDDVLVYSVVTMRQKTFVTFGRLYQLI